MKALSSSTAFAPEHTLLHSTLSHLLSTLHNLLLFSTESSTQLRKVLCTLVHCPLVYCTLVHCLADISLLPIEANTRTYRLSASPSLIKALKQRIPTLQHITQTPLVSAILLPYMHVLSGYRRCGGAGPGSASKQARVALRACVILTCKIGVVRQDFLSQGQASLRRANQAFLCVA